MSSVVLAGCSLVAVNGPPRVDPGGRVPPRATCTSDLMVPGIDLVSAALVGGFSWSLFVRHGSEGSAGKAVLSTLTWSGTLGLSGILGLKRVQACRAFRDGIPVRSDTVRVESILAPIRLPVGGQRLSDPLKTRRPGARERGDSGVWLPLGERDV